MKNNMKKFPNTIVALVIVILLSIFGGYNLVQQNDGFDELFNGTEETPSATQVWAEAPKQEEKSVEEEDVEQEENNYSFRNETLLQQHFEKHGKEMGFTSAKDYEEAASKVVNNKKSLHKTEAEDGDDVYYLEASNEFVILSTDGYLRTYFNPAGGIKYYNRQ